MKRPTSRSSHSWISIVLAMPMLLVALTAIMMAHSRTLKLGDVRVPTRFFPGYAAGPSRAIRPDVRVVGRVSDRETVLATRSGLYRFTDGRLTVIRGLEEKDVKALAVDATGSVYAGSRDGVFRIAADSVVKLRSGDVSSVTVQRTGELTIVPVGKPALVSRDRGAIWTPLTDVADALAALPAQPAPTTVTLSRLALDIHTGTAFVGGDLEWLWIDLLGGVLAFLVATGAWLWWVARRRNAAQQPASAASRVRSWKTPRKWNRSASTRRGSPIPESAFVAVGNTEVPGVHAADR